MNEAAKQRWSWIGFPLAGLLSALPSVVLNLRRVFGDTGSLLLSGGLFGVCNAICLYWFSGLRSIWKMVALILVCMAASYVSVFVAAWAYFHLALFEPAWIRESLLSPETFFVGGFVGAFMILVPALLLLFPARNVLSICFRAFWGGLAGGLLGVVGEAAGGLFYPVRMHLPSVTFYGGDPDISLVVFWQTGMAFALWLLVWIERRSTDKALLHSTGLGQP